jgi:hypothetical protein
MWDTLILKDYRLHPITAKDGKIHEILKVLLFFHDELPERLLVFKKTDISKFRSILLQLIFT